MDNRIYADINEASSSRKKSLPNKLSPSGIKKNVQCYECGFSCSSYAQLKVHNRIHTGDKPYSCPECSYASTRNANLQRHIASMHAAYGHHSGTSIATGKRGRPPSHNSTQNTPNLQQHFNFPLLPGQNSSEHSQSFLNPISTSQPLADLPLSEIRTKEMLLAENVAHHDHHPHIPLDVAQRVPDTTLRSRLIHPASQVLSIQPHIPLTQDSVSSFSSNADIDESIVIEDDPVVEDKDLFQTKQPQQIIPVEKPVIIPNDNVIMPKPVAPSVSPDVIPINTPSPHQTTGYSCIVNNSQQPQQPSPRLIDKEPEHITSSDESSLIFPPTTPGVDLPSGTKIHQKHPLVLEIENSSIGLYLHLDLSKYICDAAQKWLSNHTRGCTGVCRSNFPLNTSNQPQELRPPSIESNSKDAHDVLPTLPIPVPTQSIPISTQVTTISKVPPIVPSKSQAFPTAILAVPQTSPTEDMVEENASHHLPNLPVFSGGDICSEPKVTDEVVHVPPQIHPVVMNTLSRGLSDTHLSKTNQNKGSSVQEQPTSGEQSLIFQRWPTLRQYMQVRCLANNQKEFSCYKCGKQFQELHQLKVHVKNHIKRYNCTQCHYSTHRMANLKRHQLTHRQENELTCSVCSAVMANKRAYTMHMLFSHKRQRTRVKDFDVWRRQFMLSSNENADNMSSDDTKVVPGMEGDTNGAIMTDSAPEELLLDTATTALTDDTRSVDGNGEPDSDINMAGEETADSDMNMAREETPASQQNTLDDETVTDDNQSLEGKPNISANQNEDIEESTNHSQVLDESANHNQVAFESANHCEDRTNYSEEPMMESNDSYDAVTVKEELC